MKITPLRCALAASAALLFCIPAADAATSAGFAAGTLTVSSDAADPLVLSCNAGSVQLNASPVAGPVACADVIQIAVTGGPGDNLIDLSALQATDFTALVQTDLIGGPGADTFIGSFAADRMVWNPGDGSDTMDGRAGNDRSEVNGSTGNNTFTMGTAGVAPGFDLRFVGPFTIDIVGTEVLEVNGGDGDDTLDASGLPAGLIAVELTGGAGSDTVIGSAGDDTLIWNPGDGSDTNDGGDGDDRVVVNGSSGNNVFSVGTAGVAPGFDLRFVGPFTIDIVRSEVLEVNGMEGDDSINASGLPAGLIALELTGGPGSDTLIGSAGDDTLIWNPGDGSDTNDGGDGDDRVVVNGSSGNNVFSMGTAGVAPGFDLRFVGPFTIDIVRSEVLEVNGLGGDDSINASGLPAGLIALELNGGAGNDQITGSAGDDVLRGGDQNDTLVGLLGTDQVFGEDGNDTLIWNPGDASDLNDGGSGVDITRVVAAGASETFEIAPVACAAPDVDPCARIRRTLPSAFEVTFVRVEQLDLQAGGGRDSVFTRALDGVQQLLDGGGPDLGGIGVDFFPVDTLQIEGFSDPRSSPVSVPGMGEIHHANFEFAPTMALASLAGEAGHTSALDGSQEVPPVSSSATASGSVVLSADGTRIVVRLAFEGLSSANTAAHIHGPAPIGVNAGVIFGLGNSGATSGTLGPLEFAVNAQQAADLKAGLWYFNVHSANHPGGEVRGQILADQVFQADLSPDQVVGDPVTSLAQGIGSVILSGTGDSIVASLSYQGLTGEGVPGVSTGVRLRGPATRGAQGPELIDFPLRVSGTASDTFITQAYPITPEEAEDLRAGRWYFEVESTEFPAGELRGQLDNQVFCSGFEQQDC
ncbi:CHRD domain-containing protein [Pseudomarimonas arenosa]|uniref:CHRD domain-containing protein n=1 Tax=Pseudomarimonas arenosa TaxID=2774145 RepID=A0AAW3ZH44_9GAMM|nr:CHRD domain-containing protein [Pseudomarimonas arenosa]MBD8525423.1 CHRD domain-containing protein [Pseudomarimonas arenosa]